MGIYSDTEGTVVQEIAGLLSDAQDRFRSFHDAIEFDLSFGLDLEHYANDSSPTERQLDRVKPRDPGLFRIWRYKTALLLKRFPKRVEARGKTAATDPSAVERARRRVESVVNDPYKNYDDCRRRMVGGAIGARAWGAELCYDADCGLFFDALDPRLVFWSEGFLHPHHPKNPWTMRVSRMRLDAVRRMGKKGWRVPAELKGDPGFALKPSGGAQVGGTGVVGESEGTKEKFVTVVRFYCRFLNPVRTRTEQEVALEPGMRYLACGSCGWTSPPQAESVVEYPDAAMCPDCGQMAGLVKNHPSQRDGVKYTNGKRLVICAPFAGEFEPFYDGDWEFDYPTFPVALLVAYPPPHQPIGQSDTSVLKTPTLTKNALVRLSYETLIKSQPYWRVPSYGLTNVYGSPFTFSAEDGNIMVYDGMPGSVEVMQGQGVNQSIFTLYGILDSIFRTNESTSEVALSPSQLSEAKVGTVEQYTETGNVVVDDHGALLYQQEGFLFSCVAAALREMPSEDVGYRDPAGQWQYERTGGPTMAAVDVIVGAGRTMEQMDADELQAYMTLVQMPPEARQGYAALKHIDPSVFEKVPFVPPALQGPGGPVPPGGPPASVAMTNGVSNA